LKKRSTADLTQGRELPASGMSQDSRSRAQQGYWLIRMGQQRTHALQKGDNEAPFRLLANFM